MTYVPWSAHVLAVLPLTAGSVLLSVSAFRYASDQHSSDHLASLFLLVCGMFLQGSSVLGFMIVASGRKALASCYSSLVVLVLLAAAGLGCVLLVRDSHSEGYRAYLSELLDRARSGERAFLTEMIRHQNRHLCCGVWNSSDWDRPDFRFEAFQSCQAVARELKEQPHKVVGCYVQVFLRQKRFALAVVVTGVAGALVQAIMTTHSRARMMF